MIQTLVTELRSVASVVMIPAEISGSNPLLLALSSFPVIYDLILFVIFVLVVLFTDSHEKM